MWCVILMKSIQISLQFIRFNTKFTEKFISIFHRKQTDGNQKSSNICRSIKLKYSHRAKYLFHCITVNETEHLNKNQHYGNRTKDRFFYFADASMLIAYRHIYIQSFRFSDPFSFWFRVQYHNCISTGFLSICV